MAVKYFIYSSEQMKFRKSVDAKIGRMYYPGQLYTGARAILFTELSSTGKSRYSDAKIVYKGETDGLKYTLPETI